MLTGSYLAGDTLVHRARPALKVAALALLTLALVLGGSVALGVVAVLVGGLYAVARVPVRVAFAQVWPLRWLILLLFGFQVWSAGWGTAALVCGNLVVAVAAASLLTLTTRVDDLRAGLEHALRRTRLPGVDPERVSLAVALMIRSIPVVTAIAQETRQARSARGLDRSLRAAVTPTVVRTIRHAQQVGEALQARGVDD